MKLATVVYTNYKFGAPLLLTRYAYILVLNELVEYTDKEQQPDLVGELNVTVLKKPRPSEAQFRRGMHYLNRYSKHMQKPLRLYGPYKYYNVPYSLWTEMKNRSRLRF